MFGFLRRQHHARLRELLSSYLDGQVTEAERLQVEAHLESCAACRVEVEQLQGVVSLLRRMPQLVPRRPLAVERTAAAPRGIPRYLWGLRTAAATAAAALALVVAADLSGVLPGDPGGMGLAPAERAEQAAPTGPEGPAGPQGPAGPTIAMQESETETERNVTRVVERESALTAEEKADAEAEEVQAAAVAEERSTPAEDAATTPTPAPTPAPTPTATSAVAPPGLVASQPSAPSNAYLPAVEGSLAGLLVALAGLLFYLTRRRRRHVQAS